MTDESGRRDGRWQRRSIRMREKDYSEAGAYFVTICVAERRSLFGCVVDGEMRLTAAGRMVQARWQALSALGDGVAIDAFVVMPNHLHGIVTLSSKHGEQVGAPLVGALPIIDPRAPPKGAPTPDGAPVTRVREPDGAPVTRVREPDGAPVTRVREPDGAPITRVREPLVGALASPVLGNLIGAFKSLTTVAYIRRVKTDGWPSFSGRLWQRNFYEHVIRSPASIDRFRQYIQDNPARWDLDRENPRATGCRDDPP